MVAARYFVGFMMPLVVGAAAVASGGTGIIVVPVLPILETITAIHAERR